MPPPFKKYLPSLRLLTSVHDVPSHISVLSTELDPPAYNAEVCSPPALPPTFLPEFKLFTSVQVVPLYVVVSALFGFI